ncbi:MAG: sensor histidine kinase [Burkholderiales bacterium]|nr:sensor histidine kinase [Burkholderiales bacterium]
MFQPIQPGVSSRFPGERGTRGLGLRGADRGFAGRFAPRADGPLPVAAAVTAAVEQERARVAHELHDDVTQALFALKIDCAWLRQNLQRDPRRALQRLEAMQALLDGSAASVRRIATGLRPLALAEQGLAPAIERLVREFLACTGTRCDLYLAGDLGLHEPYASTLFRLVQEALANARKHADAKEVTVNISRQGDLLSFCVRDDGKGFSPRAAQRADAMGLAGMQERVHLVGGELLVSSTPGGGTMVAGCMRVDPQPDADPEQRGGDRGLL